MRTAPVDRDPFRSIYPFQSHFLSVNGLNYHYLDEGEGRPVVMVHGNPTWSFFYRRLILSLRDEYRTIVPDHIGCGLSAKPNDDFYDFRLHSRVSDLTTFLTYTVPDGPVTLIVHDWGGMIALCWALPNIHRISRLVVMNTAGFFPPQGHPLPKRLRLLRKPNPVMDRAVLQLNLFARSALYMAAARPMSRMVKAGLIAPYNCPQHRIATLKFVQDIPLSVHDPSGPLVAEVDKNLYLLRRIPVMVVWGGRDFVFSRSFFDEWRRRLPDAQFHWLPNAGHYLLEDEPDRVAGLISRFLHHSAEK